MFVSMSGNVRPTPIAKNVELLLDLKTTFQAYYYLVTHKYLINKLIIFGSSVLRTFASLSSDCFDPILQRRDTKIKSDDKHN